MRTPPEFSALEVAVGWPIGGRARAAPCPASVDGEPLAALASAIENALDGRAPAVAFSGGRDSSLLLAVAALVCRRNGLDPPLPITLDMPDACPEADEYRWQELVLDHLEIPHWQRIPISGELDLIGPYARQHLLRDGLLFPANVHSIVPMLEAAGERRLIVGLGGDELLTPKQWRSIHDLFAHRRGPQRRDVLRLAACAIPRPIRGVARSAFADVYEEVEWLRPAARSSLAWSVGKGFEQPVAWRAAISHIAGRRDVVLSLRAMERLAHASGKKLLAPLLDTGFVGTFARAGGLGGWGTRTATMDALAGDLLPAKLVGRDSKATFNRVLFGEESRAFAARWSGRGLDETLVDPEALRREWLSEIPDFRSALLLQSAWLADREPDFPPAADQGFDLVPAACS